MREPNEERRTILKKNNNPNRERSHNADNFYFLHLHPIIQPPQAREKKVNNKAPCEGRGCRNEKNNYSKMSNNHNKEILYIIKNLNTIHPQLVKRSDLRMN